MEQPIKILILEDNMNDADLVQRKLEKSGFRFISKIVQTREAYMNALDRFCPDLILSDYSLPSFDGISAFHIKQEKYPHIPFILVSGTIGDENVVELLKQGATDFVYKNLHRLPRAVERALEDVQIQKEKVQAEQELIIANAELLRAKEELSKFNLELEAKIKRRTIELEIANKTKDKFFSIISHDLKNQFLAILSSAEIMQMHAESNELEENLEFSKIVHDSVLLVNKLLDNLMDWARLQTGTFHAEIKKHNLKDIADEIYLLCNKAAKNKNIDFRNNLESDIFVHCDLEMTKTIFRNLITNAIKFTNSKGTIVINFVKNETDVEIAISDIRPESIPYLFAIEKNISTLGTNNEQGTGLGLILSKELIEKQNGKIWVNSELGKGSEFKFTLPRCSD